MTTSALSRMLETEELSAFGGILKKFPQRGHILTTAHVRELVIGNVVADYDVLIVRSGSRVDRAVLDAAQKL
ncbi:hypothetical protein PF010_g32178 [Phytophthora fragariae]|uniref:D-isomer specific 2-hydroxyacid dehydrogenase catalytic domain-containing protein n=1 Tax=Phytophthora fragariae TaxID=53985 RepID=A0A6A3P9Z2_9STRA|nr:hypothetical protein PF009_g32694 [Phytophthora fragariae]KAE9055365.1 hypothetical protein PF010_g32178 [Phytophthora fragariae]KAE9056134.1 hypothetical protein PF007_g32088 [Phytophthora fragariae]KAE9260709.1 hypothetical protein PF001_g32642 [Phytophthora fragariae]